MPITASNLKWFSLGSEWKITGDLTWSTYTSGGDSIIAGDIGMSRINSFEIKGDDLGFAFDEIINLGQNQVNVLVYNLPGGTPGGTVNPSSAGTPAGTNAPSAVTGTAAAQGFTGIALGNHNHELTYAVDEGNLDFNRLYISGATGPFTVGETITQAVSGATANVLLDGTNLLNVDTVVGTFDTTHAITGGTSGHTANVDQLLLDVWGYGGPKIVTAAQSNTGQVLSQAVSTFLALGANQYRPTLEDGRIETPASDGWNTVYVLTVELPTTGDSAGTPSGTNASSAITGTAAAQGFTGTPMGNHSHTFTGTSTSPSPESEVTNGTDLAAEGLVSVAFEATGSI